MKWSFAKARKLLGQFIGKHSSKILVGAAIGGVVGTAVIAGKSAVEAHDKIIEAELRSDEPLTTMEKVKIAAPIMVKPAICVILTSGTILGIYKNEHKKAMTLAGALAISEASFDEVQGILTEKMGEEAVSNLKDDILKRRMATSEEQKDNSDAPIQYVFSDDDPVCFKDMESGGDRIWLRPSRIKGIENEFNSILATEGYGSLNDLRDIENLDRIGIGDDMGWRKRDGYFSFKLGKPDYDEFGRVYIPLHYATPPRLDYMNV